MKNQPSLDLVSSFLLRYSLVLIISWIGILKFLPYEAEGIAGLVEESPFMSWGYLYLDIYQLSGLMGIIEIAIALLIAFKPVSPRLSVWGSVGGIIMFLCTLSFMFTTPGVIKAGAGMLALSGGGQSLLKDTMLLAASLWTLADSRRSVK